MTMIRKPLTLFRYSIPFRKPFRSASGVIQKREGLLIGNGTNIWTEIAPLPGFSTESLDDTLSFLKTRGAEICSHYHNNTLDCYLSWSPSETRLAQLPSVRFGLSMLAEQQKAIDAGLPLFAYWQKQFATAKSFFDENAERIEQAGQANKKPPCPHSASSGNNQQKENQQKKNQQKEKEQQEHRKSRSLRVSCNALVALSDIPELINRIHSLRNNGFKTVKLKIPGDTEPAFSVITEMCSRFPDLLFRFDANRTYSLQDAHRLLGRIREEFDRKQIGKNLQYLEEPVKTPDPVSLLELRKYGIPFAADESARTSEQIRSIADGNYFDFIVLKPSLFGSLDEMSVLIERFLPVVVSSSFETVVGRTLLAHLAALFNTKWETEHGLAAGSFLLDDMASAKNGNYIPLFDIPGIGIRPDVTRPWLTPIDMNGNCP